MSLKAPRRLPKQFRRSVSTDTRSLARQYTFTPERRKRKRHERWVRLSRRLSQFRAVVTSEFRMWLIIGSGIVVVVVSSVLLFAPFFNVRTINIQRRDPRIDIADVQQALAPLFHQRLVLITRNQVSTILQSSFPDITSVAITKEYPSTLTVALTLEPIVAEIMIEDNGEGEAQSGTGSSVTETGSLRYSYITAKGTFVSTAIRFSKAPIERFTITDWSVKPQQRTTLLRPQFLQTILLARDTLRRDFGLSPTKIIVYLRAQEFHIKTAKGTLWFDTRTDLAMQFQRFREFLKMIPLEQVKEYVDLRIADKIVYK